MIYFLFLFYNMLSRNHLIYKIYDYALRASWCAVVASSWRSNQSVGCTQHVSEYIFLIRLGIFYFLDFNFASSLTMFFFLQKTQKMKLAATRAMATTPLARAAVEESPLGLSDDDGPDPNDAAAVSVTVTPAGALMPDI